MSVSTASRGRSAAGQRQDGRQGERGEPDQVGNGEKGVFIIVFLMRLEGRRRAFSVLANPVNQRTATLRAYRPKAELASPLPMP